MGIVRHQRRLSVLLVLAGILTNLALLLVTLRSIEWQRASQNERIADVAEATARVLALKLSSLASEAKVIAAAVADSSDDVSAVEALLHMSSAASGHHYILGDQNITQLINTSAPRGVDRATIREPGELKSIFGGREMLITEPRKSRFVGEWREGRFHPEHFFGVRVPVRIKGEVRYVLTLLARRGVIRDVLATTYRPRGWGATILDQKGRRIARIPEDPSLIGKQGHAEALDRSPSAPRGLVEVSDMEGNPSTAALTAIPETPWRVGVWAHHDVLAERRSMLGLWFALGNLLLLIGLFRALPSASSH